MLIQGKCFLAVYLGIGEAFERFEGFVVSTLSDQPPRRFGREDKLSFSSQAFLSLTMIVIGTGHIHLQTGQRHLVRPDLTYCMA